MASYKDLKEEVNKLNNKYCKASKNEFSIHRAYGGYCVELTGKTYKRNGKEYYRKGSLRGSGVAIGNQYHDTAAKTIRGIKQAEERGWVKEAVRHYNKPRKDW